MLDRSRFVITDAVWAQIAPLLPGKPSDRGVTAKDNRLFLEAVLWRVRTGPPWRDLPPEFGNWNSVFQRFRRWVRTGVFERIFERLSAEPDFEYALIDGTIVSAHQKASGVKDPMGHRTAERRLGIAFGALLGDKAFDVDWLRAELDARGAAAVIPPRTTRKGRFDFDREMYRWRHLIENTFAKLKEFRAVATRYDKTDTSFRASICLAAAVIASR